MWHVYVLYSMTGNKSYVGYTNDIERRIFEHNVSEVRGFTLRSRPWILIHTEPYSDKGSAIARMENIPVSFECEGRNYRGTLDAVHGAGTEVFHLMIEKRYNGRLRLTEHHGWVFDPTPYTVKFKELIEYFGDIIFVWYE